MMRKTSLLIGTLLIAVFMHAQESPGADTLWKYSGVSSLNVSQLSLSNWAAGGQNSLSGNALLQLSADFNNGKLTWDNDLTMGYGLVRQGNDPTSKSNDKLDLSSKIGMNASDKWSYTGLLNFRTQFAKGYDKPDETDRTKISNWLAPGYINIAAGMDFKPNDEFSMFLAPVTGKVTIVLDDDLSAAGSFGLDPDETLRGEFGGYIKIAFKKEILKNVLLDTKIDFFSNYLENPQYVDVNWDMLLSFKVNDFISATLVTQLIYDRDIEFAFDSSGDGINDSVEPRVQFKELFGIGLTYNF
jgi:hypothetical protein